MRLPRASKRFGVIVGLGTPAAHYYYEQLVAACARRNTAGDFFMATANFDAVLALIRSDDRVGLATYLCSFITELKKAGAGTVALSAVMPHVCFRELQMLSPLPIIDIVDVLAQHLYRNDIYSIALLGTEVTMRTQLFGRFTDFLICEMSQEEIRDVQQIYVSIQRAGHPTADAVDYLRRLCEDLHRNRGAQEIVIAGTDLAAVFDPESVSFPFLNAAEVHVEAIAHWAGA